MLNISDSCMRRIMIVEGDCHFRDSLDNFLQTKGYDVTSLSSAIDVYEAIRKNDYDLAIIDSVLPDQDGFIIAKYLSFNTCTRVLIISEHASIEDRLRGYESGAGMYLTKPVDLKEISSAAAVLLQSNPVSYKDSVEKAIEDNKGIWNLKIDEWSLVTPDKKTISLTGKEYMLLERLARESQGGVVSREVLLHLLDYPKNKHGNHSLESLVHRLRKKMSSFSEKPIKTINALGYSFVAKIKIY